MMVHAMTAAEDLADAAVAVVETVAEIVVEIVVDAALAVTAALEVTVVEAVADVASAVTVALADAVVTVVSEVVAVDAALATETNKILEYLSMRELSLSS